MLYFFSVAWILAVLPYFYHAEICNFIYDFAALDKAESLLLIQKNLHSEIAI